MGFNNHQGGNNQYAQISNGKIVIASREPKEGHVPRVNKVGTTVYEKHHDEYTGYLVDIAVDEGKYGKQWVFTMRDNPEDGKVILQAFYDSSYGTGVVNSLLNTQLDLSQKFTISPYDFETTDGKRRTGVTIKQRGQKIPWQYTKDNGLPAWEQVKVKGAMTWDSTASLEFLEAKIADEITPRIGKTLEYGPDTPDAQPAPVPVVQLTKAEPTTGDDELPF